MELLNPSPELDAWVAIVDRVSANCAAFTETELRGWARSRWGALADAFRAPSGAWVIIYGQHPAEFVSNPSQRIAMANAIRHSEVSNG